MNVTIETYMMRRNLTFKLLVLENIKNVSKRIKMFFKKAAESLKGEMADVFMVNPKDINNLCKSFSFNLSIGIICGLF